MSKQWKCMECGSISRYKGLCRDCTEYDGDGNIVTPVARVRIDEFGNEYVVKRPERQRLTKDMMLLQRKSQRRLTKRQSALMQERLKADAEALKATADVEVSEDGLIEFGEAVEEEE